MQACLRFQPRQQAAKCKRLSFAPGWITLFSASICSPFISDSLPVHKMGPAECRTMHGKQEEQGRLRLQAFKLKVEQHRNLGRCTPIRQ
eukprot:1152453-Pelagomonas_calceolata.AAC.9